MQMPIEEDGDADEAGKDGEDPYEKDLDWEERDGESVGCVGIGRKRKYKDMDKKDRDHRELKKWYGEL